MPLGIGQDDKSLDELEEENSKLKVQYSNEQIRNALREAKEKHGVTLKSFGGNVTAFIKWLKTH